MQDLAKQISELGRQITSLGKLLKVDSKRKKAEELQGKMAEPGFWNNQKSASEVVSNLKALRGDVNNWDSLSNKLKDIKELISLKDTSLESEITAEVEKLAVDYRSLKLALLFSGKFDNANAIVEINSGAGGTEACDWASMLFRMYFRWAEEKKFKLKVLNEVSGEEAGIKNITFFIEGRKAYGLLKSERGVHRLVRISPFDANKRRHTSFASVDVLPEVKGDIDIEIKPEEMRIDTYRSSGAGGQHVNVTDSAVRITHLPSGIVVACQSERSQHQNKQSAIGVLRAKLYERREAQNKKELQQVAGKKQKIEWGSQIRSYVLHPYMMVKDHRTDKETGNARAVLDGKLDDFIYAYLQEKAK